VAYRDIVVIGASLGGVDALRRLVGLLPADLNAAVLVVNHMDPSSTGHLPRILSNVAKIPFAAAVDGEKVETGRGYVAVPNRHLMIEARQIRLSRGPRESHARPAVDNLFRSAAYGYGQRVIGIVLTGLLDDGTAGLWAIKDRGGIAIVQSPDEAAYPSMPRSALTHVEVDYSLTISEIAAVLPRLTSEKLPDVEAMPMKQEPLQIEVDIGLGKSSGLEAVTSLGERSVYTCPECHGSLTRIEEGPIRRFRCHTGHAFGEESLGQSQAETIEQSLYQVLALMEEREALLRSKSPGQRSEADEVAAYAERVRRLAEDVVTNGPNPGTRA
jgi:two-component system, chemotaxis family, protein-glutamate methylesterase/glutaminase